MKVLFVATAMIAFGPLAAAASPTNTTLFSVAAQGCRPVMIPTVSVAKVFRDCQSAPQLIPLRGGTFSMGDQVGDGQPYELPVHQVNVNPFALGRFEVTSEEWRACQNAGACTESADPADERHGAYPVAGISWVQAEAYTAWLSKLTGKPYRLPSEAEWEYAARAGNSGRYPWTSVDEACKRANLFDVSGSSVHPDWYWFERCDDHFPSSAPVGSFPPNAWGFHEMLGNVWEWVEDCWHPDYTGAPSTSIAWLATPCRKHVNRGGGWGNNQRSLRLSNRDADPANAHSDALGFRVARDLSREEVSRYGQSAPDVVAPKGQVESASRGTNGVAPVVGVAPPPVLAAAQERDFEVHITIHGQQTWVKPPQHAIGATEQEVTLRTRLRSDGVLYADNLLDADPSTRFAIKQRYYARQGLLQIMAEHGGRLPSQPEEIHRLADQVEAGLSGCMATAQCASEIVYRSAAVEALRESTPRDIDALVGAPGNAGGARWAYYFGYSGCPSSIHITNHTHLVGERSIFKGGSRMVPWEVDRFANSQGSQEDLQQLCQRYVASVDVQTGDVYIENLYIPSVPGVTIRSRSGKQKRVDDNLSVPSGVLAWAGERLRKTRETAEYDDNLAASAPFDEDYTILGRFEGEISVKLEWSFKPKT